MKNIEIIRINKIVHLFIEGKTKLTYNLATKEEAIELYKKIESFKGNVQEVIDYLNKFNLKKDEYGFYYDQKKKVWYYDRIDLPIPKGIRDIIVEYVKENHPTEALYNFLGLMQQNPYPEVRERLFKFIEDNGLMVINGGYFITYKAVEKIAIKESNEFDGKENLIKEYYNKIKRWKKNPKKFYLAVKNNDYILSKKKGSNLIIGNIADLHSQIESNKFIVSNDSLYRTLYSSKKITFKLGEIITESDYDTDSSVTCSRGIHAGTERYAYSYGSISTNSDNVIVACLVNPKNVVAVPHDGEKIRAKEIFPLAIVKYEGGNLSNLTFESKYSDIDYMKHEADNLERELVDITIWDKIPKGFEDLSKGEYEAIIKNRLTKIS